MNPQPPTTHAETAWVLTLPSSAIAGIALLLIALVFVSQTGRIAQMLFRLRRQRAPVALIDPALVYRFQPISEAMLSLVLLAGALVGAALSLLVSGNNLALAMIASAGFALTPAIVAVFIGERRYVQRLDDAMVSAIGRLITQMRAGNGFQIAFASVTSELDPGPLKEEWQWIIDHIGVRLEDRTMAMASDVCLALAAQTPSSRHAAFLLLLESALRQSFSEQVARISAAYAALTEGIRRTSMLKAELSQMRNSGIALFLINVFMTGYMAVAQFDRFVTAYTSPFGPFAAVILTTFTFSPLIAGFLLSRFDDVVY